MRRMHRRPSQQRGIGLLDVMLALLVLGPAVLALARLEALVLRHDSHAQARAIAAQLAREKLDDLRQFMQLPAAAPGVYGFDELASNGGGRENADGSLVLAAGEVLLSDTRYTRSWSVAGYSWCAPAAAMTAGACEGAARPAIQQVQVSIAWTDSEGIRRSLTLETAIAAVDPALAVRALVRRSTAAAPRVQLK